MNESRRQYPTRRYAWYMVVVLTLAYILSFVDRYVIGLLVEPIKADLGLSDTEIGWLLGLSFALFYATMGVPLGWLADRKRRTWLISIGVTVWSAATFASGLARNFWSLFVCRMTIGAGEASLSPSAISMITDSFPREARSKPIAFYTAALATGAGIASLVGAGVLTWAKSVPQITVPLLGDVAPWQFTFFAVGAPGAIFAILFLFMREPARHRSAGEEPSRFPDTFVYIWQRRGTFLSYVSPMCVTTIVAYSWSWFAAMFERTWGWAPEHYAFVIGIVTLACGPAAVMFAGWLSDRWIAAGRQEAPLTIMAIGLSIQVPTAIAVPLMPTPEAAIAVLALTIVGNAMTSATGATGLMNMTPSLYRGQTVALYFMTISLSGLVLGPGTIGWLSDNVFGNEYLNYAAAATPALYGIPVLLLLPYALRAYRAELGRQAAERASGSDVAGLQATGLVPDAPGSGVK